MTYEKIFATVKKSFAKANTKSFTSEFAFQFNITGEGEGIFYVAFKDGVLAIEPYDYLDRDVIFTADAKTLIAVAEGKTEVDAAMNEGKLFVDGNTELAKQIGLLVAKKTAKKATTAKKAPAKKPAAKKTTAKAEAPKAAAKAEAPKAAAKAEAPKAAAKAEAPKAAAKAEAPKAAAKAEAPKAAAKTASKK